MSPTDPRRSSAGLVGLLTTLVLEAGAWAELYSRREEDVVRKRSQLSLEI